MIPNDWPSEDAWESVLHLLSIRSASLLIGYKRSLCGALLTPWDVDSNSNSNIVKRTALKMRYINNQIEI